MNLPTNAKDVHAALANAFNTGDVDIVKSMYDLTGLVMPEPGVTLSGEEEFEKAIKGLLSIKGKMEIKTVYCFQTGNIALGRSEWNITDNEEVKISSKGIEVMKQQADGSWKIIIDHTFGAESHLVP